jgi:hypothetical protein
MQPALVRVQRPADRSLPHTPSAPPGLTFLPPDLTLCPVDGGGCHGDAGNFNIFLKKEFSFVESQATKEIARNLKAGISNLYFV